MKRMELKSKFIFLYEYHTQTVRHEDSSEFYVFEILALSLPNSNQFVS